MCESFPAAYSSHGASNPYFTTTSFSFSRVPGGSGIPFAMRSAEHLHARKFLRFTWHKEFVHPFGARQPFHSRNKFIDMCPVFHRIGERGDIPAR